MVRIATSVAAVTILAGAALAQVQYDEQVERSVSETENLEAREPLFFSLFKTGVKQGIKQGVKHGKQSNNDVPRAPVNIDNLGGLPPSQRSLAEDEELFGRAFEELEERDPWKLPSISSVRSAANRAKHAFGGRRGGGHRHGGSHLRHMGSAMNSAPQPQESQQQRREFDDIEDLEMREFDDVEDIEAREPGKGGHLVHWAAKKLAKHGGNAIPQGSDSQEQDRREFDDAEELEMREYDDELEAREPGRFGRWASRKFGGRHGRHGGGGAPPSEEQQQERREFDDADDLEMREYDDAEELEMREYDDELEAREPGRFGRWASRKFGGRRHGGGGSPPPEEQQQERREFNDAEELEMREFDDADELEAREPGRFGRWASRKFGGRHGRHGGGGAPPSDEQQQERREFDDLEDLEVREFDDELEEVLARDFEEFDELD